MRDDIDKLPLPAEAKRYARRSGLKSMLNQPKQFVRVNQILTNPGKPNVVKNYDVGCTTSGKKGAPQHAIKEDAARIVNLLLTRPCGPRSNRQP